MRETPGKQLVLGTLVAIGLAAGAGTAHANTSTAFPSGSLIVPPGAAFQDDCGSVSTYGLIYDVLRANPYLTRARLHRDHDLLRVPRHQGVAEPLRADDARHRTDDERDVERRLRHHQRSGDVDQQRESHDRRHQHRDVQQPVEVDVSPGYPSQTVSGFARVSYLGGPFIILASDAHDVREAARQHDHRDRRQRQHDRLLGVPHAPRVADRAAEQHVHGRHRSLRQHPPREDRVRRERRQGVPVGAAAARAARDRQERRHRHGVEQHPSRLSDQRRPQRTRAQTAARRARPRRATRRSARTVPRRARSTTRSTSTISWQPLTADDGSGNPLYTMLWTPHWQSSQVTTYTCQKTR